jgi:predicted TIM-barrel fold metal-dependent hydrolase
MLPPLLSLDKALDELRWAKEHGACGLLKKGDKEAGHWPAEEYFFPLYEEAQRLDMTICFHIGGGVPDHTPARQFSHVGFMQLNAPIMNAFHALINHNLPAQFPRLRFAFVENGASWVPYCVYKLQRNKERRQNSEAGIGGPDYDLGQSVLRDNRMYVTCQVDEDVPYLLRCAGRDNLMVGSDYAHSDPSQEGHFASLLRAWADRGELSPEDVERILYANPRECYGL